ncbi:MAG: T9SS type A sorting domain-containing protein, partial [Chitinophagales bacterium]
YAQCNASLWSHVYNSYRLQVNNSCMTVTGTVYSLIYEADGDIHIRLTVDSPYTNMLNSVNYSGQYGKLVCEPVCATTVTQADAVSSCAGFTNTVFIPAVGEHVHVTGSYVTDNDHGWNEIHPVTSIVIGSGTSVSNINAANAPEVTIFPNPATSRVNFKLSEKPSSPVYIIIADELGHFAGQYQMLEMLNLEINTQYLPSGKYFYRIRQDEKLIKSGDFAIVK